MQKSTGKTPPQLARMPELPEGTAYLWDWFRRVRGREPLTFTELRHWSDLTATPLRPYEAEALFELDRILLSVLAEG